MLQGSHSGARSPARPNKRPDRSMTSCAGGYRLNEAARSVRALAVGREVSTAS
jgi:hypothetical protein